MTTSELFGMKVAEKSVLCFGELLLRICPDEEGKWLDKNTLPFFIGGAEGNVATALALWDVPSAYFTVLPDNMMAKQLAAYLVARGIDMSRLIYQGERIGLFFLPYGKDMKNSAVIYDRKYSSFDRLVPKAIDWDRIFEGVSWLHLSAISPALNQQVADVCLEAVQAASAKGIGVSFDLNHRASLWKYGKTPSEIIPQIAASADLIMGNIWSANLMLNLGLELPPDTPSSDGLLAAAERCSAQILKTAKHCKAAALTFRMDSEKRMEYFTSVYTENTGLLKSRTYETSPDIDRVGSGDCFMAGLIFGIMNRMNLTETLAYATAAAYTKFFVHADATNVKKEVINNIASNTT